jgi:hypothetical protein
MIPLFCHIKNNLISILYSKKNRMVAPREWGQWKIWTCSMNVMLQLHKWILSRYLLYNGVPKVKNIVWHTYKLKRVALRLSVLTAQKKQNKDRRTKGNHLEVIYLLTTLRVVKLTCMHWPRLIKLYT